MGRARSRRFDFLTTERTARVGKIAASPTTRLRSITCRALFASVSQEGIGPSSTLHRHIFSPLPALGELVGSLREQKSGLHVNLLIQDNSPDPATTAQLQQMLGAEQAFASVDVQRSGENVGFGRGHNANALRGRAPFFFILNQDCVLEPNVLVPLFAAANADDARVAAWELRQLPYEQPKVYDPVTLDVPWVSGAATLLRRNAFDAVGVEPRIFWTHGTSTYHGGFAEGSEWRYLPR